MGAFTELLADMHITFDNLRIFSLAPLFVSRPEGAVGINMGVYWYNSKE
jgi:hypothetical protein